MDAETGLIYFQARYYDPAIGRFITEDPYEGDWNTPLSLHHYLYAYANPTVYVDLHGYVAIDPFAEPGLGKPPVVVAVPMPVCAMPPVCGFVPAPVAVPATPNSLTKGIGSAVDSTKKFWQSKYFIERAGGDRARKEQVQRRGTRQCTPAGS